MLSGVELGQQVSSVRVGASTKSSGILEIWMDNLQTGQLIAKVPFQNTGGKWTIFKHLFKKVSGQHDIYVKFPAGVSQQISLRSIQFTN